ncbi:hypothetical protein ACFL2I_07035 [Candidatus Omnitrophota bacterium]
MKKTLFWTLLFIPILCGTVNSYETDRFSINFPSQPKIYEAQTKIDDKVVNITNYQCDDGIGLYTISFGEFSPVLNTPLEKKEFIKGVFNGLLGTAKDVKVYTKEQSDTTPYDLSYLYSANFQGIQFMHMGLISLNSDREYIKITLIYPADQLLVAGEKYKHFLDSFEFHNK